MEKTIFLSVFTLLLFTSCNKSKIVEDTTTTTTTTAEVVCPDCLNIYIEEMLQFPKQDPRGTIKAYIYQNDTVFAVNSSGVDAQTLIYNEKCELICYYGGLTGHNTCINWDNATYLDTVWIDPR